MTRFLGMRGNRLNLVALCGVTMPALMSFGYNQVLLGGVLTLRSFNDQFPEIDIANAAPSDKQRVSVIQGTVVALYAIGGLFGALLCIGLGDILGRRRVIMVASVLQLLGVVLMGSAYSFAHLIVSRIILGLGIGGLMATAPVWQSEISPAAKRGTHVVTTGLFGGIGGTIALFLDLGMSFAPGTVGWRFPFVFQALFPLMSIVIICFLPESPRWLIRQNRVGEARDVLAALESIDPNHPKVDAEIKDVQSSLRLTGEGSLRQVFHMGPQRALHRAFISVAAMSFLQLTGVNVITFYTTTIFETYLELGSIMSRVLAAVYQSVALIGGTLCIFTVEGFGRRNLMLAGAAGNTICLALVAGLGSQPLNQTAIHAAVAFIFLYHFSFIVGFAGVPILYATEIAPLKMRGTINGLSLGFFWAFCVLIAEITPIAFEAIGWRLFIIFAAVNLAIVGVVYLFFPETAGHTLEEIDEIFVSSTTIWDPVWVAKRLAQSTGEKLQTQKDLKEEQSDVKVGELCNEH
ncbi:sugar transporter [Penicillium malachiteum]|uniref:Sugar transporter n=1 Tax=Penicillium malachiteum TaxID=1324776 RepID=A0AAD6HHZ4_9EURO|nr:sugar transporter [Penicillium malachiteum]